jgi:hypothetical protein
MPNWVTARITLNGSDENVKKVLDFVRTEEVDENGKEYIRLFDFNKVIPMPEELNIESGSMGEWGMRYLLLNAKHKITWSDEDYDFEKRMLERKAENEEQFNNMIELGQKYLTNIAKYGCKDWYQFHNKYWNTKWNSVEAEVNDNVITFDTAWSFPAPVIEKLSEMFPDVTFDFIYADEDCGSNTGSGSICNGKYSDDTEYPDSGSNRGYEIYLEVHPEYEDELCYIPEKDTYEWIDQDDENEE